MKFVKTTGTRATGSFDYPRGERDWGVDSALQMLVTVSVPVLEVPASGGSSSIAPPPVVGVNQ